ncbi:hypothetical protein EOT10_26535 [Streptomyces antnestii]|uniref:NifU family protein n=1 Tax=Streptomyces antnestii TaxID=2494256 RepID=A0A3S2VE38_9ACTN|nr:hypothetical protein [Streptomyces sp. San01]RVU20901.1 hypothetical protein EOT10_26535 [Streptomyces sp. San01]
MLDTDALAQVRRTLEADGFHLDARKDGDRLHVTVTADAGTCGDCLVPKDVLRQILQRALGIPAESVDVTYPNDSLGSNVTLGPSDTPGSNDPLGPDDTLDSNDIPGPDDTFGRTDTHEETAR